MTKAAQTPPIITTRKRAAAAIGIALFFAANRLRFLLGFRSRWRFDGQIPLNAISQHWTSALLAILIFGLAVWALVFVCCQIRGGERVYFALWLSVLAASKAKVFVPLGVAESIGWMQFVVEVAMIAAAVYLYRQIDGRNNSGLNLSPTAGR